MDVQMTLELEPAAPLNAAFFHPDGSPKRLLWCGDTQRIAFNRGETVQCPYAGRPNPCPPCCLELVGAS
jgi:hypothetical protein